MTMAVSPPFLPPAFAKNENSRGFLQWINAPERRGPLLVAPALALLFLINIMPLLWSFGLSFFNYRANRLSAPKFKGLENYTDLLNDDRVWERFVTTGIIVSSSVALQLIIGFGLAMLFARKFPLRRLALMLVLTPMMLSFVSVAIFFKLFYDPTLGALSWVVSLVTDESFALLSTPTGAILGIVIADAWMWSPFVMLLVLAGLVSVPGYLYEAAEIDRASPWKRFRTITFPYVKSLLLLALLFRTIETFKTFDLVFLITEGGPGSSTETIAIYAYRLGFQFFRTSEASALAYLILFVVIVLTSIYLYVVKRRNAPEEV
ncbi:Lactose transport system permease protein LacF [Ruegeria atlantica]|uniref:Lactose transport system permease protein LacF n=2 Tax=Ruegeria atlantica TaxID=81569 RepID=A0A0P1E2P5_9RHOB|nr:Lactose transport system permease protein LacF [Ruegeria atlantica]